MKFAALLGKKLKDDDVIEVLETHDMTVVYEFDRTHENMNDLYWSDSKPDGFQFGFDKDQVLYVVFLYITASEGFEPIDASTLDFPIYGTFDEAKNSFEADGISYSQSSGESGSSMYKWWIKGDFGSFTRHYQYQDGSLFRVTLSRKVSA
ncbi:hypothetical protein C2134_01810 [Chromobacterium sinusclupearum]|uniref:Uncharacterized protein n=1 Tax=Chromobacterium sinusclupearum TaxID=2077146 RepID=A0A2K4MTL0_9NEIS|nr:hypothetical protein [Chromobacterium sinusclupearum]POB00358.1 hypothetical protein C2134_01810 [Chromobacterium sinusclupearum]